MPIQEMPQTSKMHAVPQNIMDVEFKLIGDLTMRQFAYLLVCGLIAYFITIGVGGIFKWPLTLFFVLLGLGLAFVPIQERGLDVWVINLVKAIYTPTQRVWKKEAMIPSAFMYENINMVKQELITLAPTSSRRKLEEYLDTQGNKSAVRDPLDIPEMEYIKKVEDAFAYSISTYGPITTPAGTTVVTDDTEYEIPNELSPSIKEEGEPNISGQDEMLSEKQTEPVPGPILESTKIPTEPTPQDQNQIQGQNQGQDQGKPQDRSESQVQNQGSDKNQDQEKLLTEHTEIKTDKPIEDKKSVYETAKFPKIKLPQLLKPVTGPQKEQSQVQQGQFQQNQAQQGRPPQGKETASGSLGSQTQIKKTDHPRLTIKKSSLTLSPMTPDRHSGRKFTNFLPSQGEIILPVRGTKVLKTSEEVNLEAEMKDKAEKLQQLLAQVKQSQGSRPQRYSQPTQSGGETQEIIRQTNKAYDENLQNQLHGDLPQPTSTPDVSGPVIPQIQPTTKMESKMESRVESKVEPKTASAPLPVHPIPTPIGEIKEKSAQTQAQTQTGDQVKEVLDEQVEAENLVNKLKEQNDKLLTEIRKLKLETQGVEETPEVKAKQLEVLKLEEQQKRMESDYSALLKQVADLRGTLESKKQYDAFREGTKLPSTQTPIRQDQPVRNLTDKINVLSGFVKDTTQRGVPQTLLIIKNNRGDPVRAIKTNSLGQFILNTPLANGLYSIEASSSDNKYSFDIISFEAKGEIISPINIVAKPYV